MTKLTEAERAQRRADREAEEAAKAQRQLERQQRRDREEAQAAERRREYYAMIDRCNAANIEKERLRNERLAASRLQKAVNDLQKAMQADAYLDVIRRSVAVKEEVRREKAKRERIQAENQEKMRIAAIEHAAYVASKQATKIPTAAPVQLTMSSESIAAMKLAENWGKGTS